MQSVANIPIALIVEDDAVTQKVMAGILEKNGFEVVSASNGVEGIRTFKRTRPHVAFVDLGLPDLSGMDVITMMQAIDHHIPIVIATAQPTVSTAVCALDQRVFAYLVKPHAPDALIAVAKKAVLKEQAAPRSSVSAPRPVGQRNSRKLSNSLELLRYVFQAVVDVRGSVYGHEALVRSSGPLPSAQQLLPAAEAESRVSELLQRGHEIIASDFSLGGDEGDLFVNLVPENLSDKCLLSGPLKDMSERVILELPTKIDFPVTDELVKQVRVLRKLGYRIALDNVVDEASMLNYATLEPDFVKISRSVVQRKACDETDLRNIVRSAKKLGALTVALGVETTVEYDLLLEEGCDLFQGYLFAWPAPFSEEATTRLTSGEASITIAPGE